MSAIATIEGSVELIALSSIDEHEAGKVVPEMRSEEWTAFLADVSRRGIQEPVVVCKWKRRNVLLDGRHRVRAARLADHETIPARVIEVDEKEQVAWIIRAALLRRHLKDHQREMLGARLADAPRGGQPTNSANAPFTQKDAAEHLGVSVDSIKRAKKVLTNGTPQLIAAVDAGELPVSVAAKIADLPKREQQAVLAVHRARQGFVKMRTALANQIRGLLSEFGIVMAQGLRVVLVQAGAVAADERMALPSPMRTLIGHLHQQLKQLDAQVAQLEQLIASSVQADSAERRLQQVPGIGPITSSAIVATVGDATLFANGRQLAAWLGLVPRQHSSGGKDKLLGISKRGDGYVRTLLIHGARSLIQANERRRAAGKSTDAWLDRLLSRRNANVAAVALANRNARILWAMLVKASEYRPEARMLAAV